jgi:phytoene dehydrogenase-like protein
VVSNADLIHTLAHLVPPTAAADLRRQVHELVPTYPCFLTHLGLMGADREALDRVQGYYWSSWDPDEVGAEGLICKVFVPTLYEPGLAPPGGDVVILQKVLDLDRLAGVEWAASKERIERRLTDHLEKVVPGIGAKVVTRSSASAWTSERFTLNAGGAMLGWEMSPSQLGGARPGRQLSGLRGFHLVGHWTRPGGGITPVIVSAQKVAEEVQAEL